MKAIPSFLFVLLLSGCVSNNQVELARAQAAIEQAKAGQIIARGLANSATLNALAIFLLVFTLAAGLALALYGLYTTRRALKGLRDEKESARLRNRHDRVPGRAAALDISHINTDELLKQLILLQVLGSTKNAQKRLQAPQEIGEVQEGEDWQDYL